MTVMDELIPSSMAGNYRAQSFHGQQLGEDIDKGVKTLTRE